MKTLFTLVGLLLLLTANSQTELIAFKSRSGNMAYFKTEKIDNLGGPPIRIDSIIKLNDSTIIEYNSYGWGNNYGGPVYTDTVTNHPICKLPNNKVDSLKGNYYGSDIKFIGFDSTTIKTETIDTVAPIKIDKTSKTKKHNEIAPVVSNNNTPDNSKMVKTQNLTTYLFSGLIILLIGLTTIIWFANRKKVVIS